ncbi:Phytochrome-like protein cph2 [Pirellulimonas nuda]|uniref:Phytochrome-like protein cph2 n=1 Tax=Pirellulimonas nuda TaxID=2528009 RepID=A0A518DAE0_9BACT|nr:EAL domain-containing protein [Pirellulimonas nuda]QDU88449.1 Phytochrome-like protein cph2 [Pirellulimonas nuda]
MIASEPCLASGLWTLLECRDDGAAGRSYALRSEGLVVGRTSEASLTLDSGGVSKRHAAIAIEAGRPVVRDLGSTNGTYVNGRRVESAPLADGDVVQFADRAFRVQRPRTAESGATIEGGALPFAAALLQFEELMSGAGVAPHFQPIVTLPDGQTVGYELLARSNLEELRSPLAMFQTAARLGQECALSELMRREGARDALRMPDCHNLFVNTHPKEIVQDRFLASLAELRGLAPTQTITIEVHEAAVTNRDDMRRFRSALCDLEMQLAYDDFGAGQARLDELCEVPPECLKFDIMLVRDIDKASPTRLAMIRSLVRMVQDLGVTTLAEGVETAAEAEACTELGFELAQGYWFGRPAPAP